jgi:putative ABC transport system substrate-binding protein
VTFIGVELWGKRVELISELVPETRELAALMNPNFPGAERNIKAVEEAARAKGLQLRILRAATESEIDAAFTALAELQARALLVGAPTFLGQPEQIVALAARYAVPTIHDWHEYVAAGGLISYGTNLADTYRIIGTYVGKILKGEKPVRSAGSAADHIRAGCQSQDRHGARVDNPVLHPRQRRRGHRIAAAFRVNGRSFCARRPQPVRSNGRCVAFLTAWITRGRARPQRTSEPSGRSS